MLAFRDFPPEHAELADTIATETAAHAAVVGSGRVGRTQLLSLEEKARLAAGRTLATGTQATRTSSVTAHIEAWDEVDLYREIKGAAHDAVDDFLDKSRQR